MNHPTFTGPILVAVSKAIFRTVRHVAVVDGGQPDRPFGPAPHQEDRRTSLREWRR